MKSIRLPLGAGSEPECIEIDDAREAVGEIGCNKSPNGMHVILGTGPGPKRCIHCGEHFE